MIRHNSATSKTFTITVTEYSLTAIRCLAVVLLNGYDINGDGSPDANTDFTTIGKVQPDGWADISGNSASFISHLHPCNQFESCSGKPGLAFGSALGIQAYPTGTVPTGSMEMLVTPWL